MFSLRLWKAVIGLLFSFGLFAETLPPAMLTNLPPGYTQTVLATYSQTCSTSSVFVGPGDCVTTDGNPNSVNNRGGTNLDRVGNTYWTSTVGVFLLDEHGGIGRATLEQFAGISTITTCTFTGSGGVRAGQVITGAGFNAPLNVLNVRTFSFRQVYENLVPIPGMTAALNPPCPSPVMAFPGVVNVQSGSMMYETTDTLIRVTGPFPQGKHNDGQGNQGNDGKGDH